MKLFSKHMFIIYVTDLSTKNKKCKDGGSYFYKNKKYKQLEIEKKQFLLFHQEFLIFPIMRFFRKSSMFCQSIPLNAAHQLGNKEDFHSRSPKTVLL